MLTTTFIDREVQEARRLGLDMVFVSIRRPRQQPMGPESRQIIRDAIYLLPPSPIVLIFAHLHFIARAPGRYLRFALYLLTRNYPSLKARFKTLLHFGEGVLAAFLLKDRGIDHLHAHFADQATAVALTVSRLLDLPYSLTAHANDIYVAPLLLREKIENAKFATTCTAFNKAHLERTTNQHVELIYHGMDFSTIPAAPKKRRQCARPLILSVGQLKEKKGFPYLIEACKLLKERGYEFACEIIGEGQEREGLTALIRELEVGDIVTLRGALPHSEVLRRLAEGSIFVLASVIARNADRDGIPNVILEAMGHGLPVIATDVSGIPEVVRDSRTGLLVDPNDSAQLADAIGDLLENPGKAFDLGERASSFVRDNFDIRRNIGRLLELFEHDASTSTRPE